MQKRASLFMVLLMLSLAALSVRFQPTAMEEADAGYNFVALLQLSSD